MLIEDIKIKMVEADLRDTPIQILRLTNEEYSELDKTGMIVENKIYGIKIERRDKR